MELLQSPEFWIGLVKIIWINIILSGDNAVVLRVLLTVMAAKLLALSYLQIVPIIVVIGAGLIGWVAGEAIVNDSVLKAFVEANRWLHDAGPALGAAFVIGVGKLMQARARRQPG